MTIHRLLPLAPAIFFIASWAGANEEVRYFEKDGVTYRETRRVVQQPVVETRSEASTQTVYREETVTELRDTVRERWTPVTEYRWEAFWVNRWNPLAKPYLAYRYVPSTRWERSTETTKTPTVSRRLVPETRTVHVPVTRQRMVEQEIISRMAVSGPANTATPWTQPVMTAGLVPINSASRPIGGVARLESDPPRQGTSTAWRSSTTTRH